MSLLLNVRKRLSFLQKGVIGLSVEHRQNDEESLDL